VKYFTKVGKKGGFFNPLSLQFLPADCRILFASKFCCLCSKKVELLKISISNLVYGISRAFVANAIMYEISKLILISFYYFPYIKKGGFFNPLFSPCFIELM